MHSAWNGVAILTQTGEQVQTGRGLAGGLDDVHSRYLEGAVGGVRVGCLYLLNGNAAGVGRDIRGWEKASDHAPTWVELRNGRIESLRLPSGPAR